MKISKHVQRALAVMLCLSLFVAPLIGNPVRAQAAGTKTKSLTLYAGENEAFYYVGEMIKANKVSSSNKKVVTAEPEDSMSYKVYLTAKKAGKATVTIQTVRGGTHKLKVTVKKPDFDTDLIVSEKGIIFTSKNNMDQYFKTGVKCTLRDKTGEVLWQKVVGMYQLPGKTYYSYYGQSKSLLDRIDPKKSTVEVTWFHRFVLGDDTQPSDLRYVYNDVSKKIKSSVKVTREARYVLTYDYFKIKLKNPLKYDVHTNIYILFYDEEGNLLRVTHDIIIGGVTAKKSETVEIQAYTDYDHYEILIYGYEIHKK